MNENKRNRIEELRAEQKQKNFLHLLKAKAYPPHQLLTSNADDVVWQKINQGKVIGKTEKIKLDSLQQLIGQLFSTHLSVGTLMYQNQDCFSVEFKTDNLIQHADKMIDDLSDETLLHWFVFSIDLKQILLVEESEYGFYELTYYEGSS